MLFLDTLFNGKNLQMAQAEHAMDTMMTGDVTPEQMAAFLGAVAAKGVVAEELAGFAKSIRNHMVQVQAPVGTIDVCGTGGDASGTFNISTATTFVLAGGGVPVAKHGNRSVSSKCGGFDVLEALGIQVEQTAQQVSENLQQDGLGFIFAPLFHPAFKHVMPVRKALGVRTVFNMLGPLCNPARVTRQLLGVYDVNLLPLMAQTLKHLGSDEALIVAAEDGLDELSIAAPTKAIHLKNGTMINLTLHPSDAGLQTAPLSSILGGDAAQNASMIEGILKGEAGAARDVVVLNAAAGFMVAGKAENLEQGAALAVASIDQRKALKALQNARNVS